MDLRRVLPSSVSLLLAVTVSVQGVFGVSREAPPSFLLQWGSMGSDDGQFNYPRGIAVDETGAVYVADSGNYRIQKFRYAPVSAEETSWSKVKASYP